MQASRISVPIKSVIELVTGPYFKHTSTRMAKMEETYSALTGRSLKNDGVNQAAEIVKNRLGKEFPSDVLEMSAHVLSAKYQGDVPRHAEIKWLRQETGVAEYLNNVQNKGSNLSTIETKKTSGIALKKFIRSLIDRNYNPTIEVPVVKVSVPKATDSAIKPESLITQEEIEALLKDL